LIHSRKRQYLCWTCRSKVFTNGKPISTKYPRCFKSNFNSNNWLSQRTHLVEVT